LLEDLYNRDKQALINSTFWSSEEYVGAGPYRVAEHERGVGITLTANPSFFLGKPKIDTVRLEFVPDANARVARLLSGAIDFTEALTADQASVLRDQWRASGEGVIYVSIANTLTLRTQFRDVPNHQTSLRDVRVRRALIHAIDRDALADAASTGLSTSADTTFPRDHYLYPRIDQAIAKYPFDVRRADALLTEAGWAKGADGMFRNAAGQLFDIEVWAGATNTIRTTAATIVVDYWKRAGLNGRQFPIPQGADREFQASFPGFDVSGGDPGGYRTITSAEIPRAENRFAGPNSGGYSNPDFDALVFSLNATLNRSERDDITVATERLFTNDVAKPTLIYDVKPAAGLGPVKGITGYSGGANSRTYLFNASDWMVE
jgi:peptide/nickel transport system substrate-binding protein